MVAEKYGKIFIQFLLKLILATVNRATYKIPCLSTLTA